jgi:hypothetical protein
MAELLIPSLVNGMTQVNAHKADPSFCKNMLNYVPDMVKGVSRSSGTDNVYRRDPIPGETLLHLNSPLNGQKVLLSISPSGIIAYNYTIFAAVPVTITPTAQTYLQAASKLNFTSVEDFTIIWDVNKIVTSTAVPALTSYSDDYFIFVTTFTPGIQYRVFDENDDSVLANYTTTTTLPSDTQVSIAEQFRSQIQANRPTWTVTNSGEVVRVRTTTGKGVYIRRSGELTRTTSELFVLHKKVDVVSDLPKRTGHTGWVTKIGTDKNYRYAEFEQDFPGGVTGSWVETVKPGEASILTPSTLPVQVTFTLAGISITTAAFAGREVGDISNNPAPSFVGKKISNISLTQKRLSILSGRSVSLSSSVDKFNFYRSSTSTVIATDPIDLNLPTTNATDLTLFALQYKQDILVYTPSELFVLYSAEGLLSPTTTSVSREAISGVLPGVSPVARDMSALHLSIGSNNISLIEMLRVDTGVYQTNDVNEHVPRLIEPSANLMALANAYDTLFIGQGSKLLCVKFAEEGQKRTQSAFFYLTTGHDSITYVDFDVDQALLYISGFKDGAFLITRMNLDVDASLTSNIRFLPCLLDKYYFSSGTVVSPTAPDWVPKVSFSVSILPAGLLSSPSTVVIGINPVTGVIKTLTPYSVVGNQLQVSTSLGITQLIIGTELEDDITLLTLFPRAESGGISTPCRVRFLSVTAVESSGFSVDTTNLVNNTKTRQIFTEKKLAQPSTQSNTTTLGSFKGDRLHLGINMDTDISLKGVSWFPTTFLELFAALAPAELPRRGRL